MASSKIIAGDYSKVLIRLWSNAFELVIDPYNSALKGKARFVVNVLADTAELLPHFEQILASATQERATQFFQ